VDISQNNLTEKECCLINQGLTHNHTILGIHMIGNEASTDALGFVHAGEQETSVSHLFTRIKPGMNMGVIKHRGLVDL
jgi:hypothetical protein